MTATDPAGRLTAFLARNRDVEELVRGRARRSHADPDDVWQDAVLRLLPHYPRLGEDDEVRRYLLRIATNLCRDHARRRCRQAAAAHVESLYVCTTPEPDPVEVAVRQEIQQAVRLAARRLTRRDRSVLYARAHGLSRAEIAAETGQTTGQVKTAIEGALERARPLFGPLRGLALLPVLAGRRLRAALHASPGMIVLATWSLAIGQLAPPPRAVPEPGQDPQPVAVEAPDPKPRRPAAGPRPAVPKPGRNRPDVAAGAQSQRRPGRVVPTPPARVCVGKACVGPDRLDGWEVCVADPTGAFEPTCGTQTIVDPCPLVSNGQPIATCKEHANGETM